VGRFAGVSETTPDQPPDPDQPGEELDESTSGIEFPPDRPLGSTDWGTTALEEEAGEDFYHRHKRTEPEVWERGPTPPDDAVELVSDAGEPDIEEELVADAVDEDPDVGPLAPDDEFSGDETTRDTVDDRVPLSAEESAIHLRDEP
jgi:hypothetical protein